MNSPIRFALSVASATSGDTSSGRYPSPRRNDRGGSRVCQMTHAARSSWMAGGGAIEVALPLSQEELASLAGASRATVTRALSNWRERGFIRTDLPPDLEHHRAARALGRDRHHRPFRKDLKPFYLNGRWLLPRRSVSSPRTVNQPV